MSEYLVQGVKGMVEDVHVYDLDESIRASKYPMATDVSKVTNVITKNTRALASVDIGTGHDNFLNGVRVAFDLTVTNKIWPELERYHFFDFVSSQSTMHRITKFNLQGQCDPHVDKDIITILQNHIDYYNELVDDGDATDQEFEDAFLNVVMNIPSGFKLTARMTTDYRQLKTVCCQRHNHRLPEWRIFCKWCIDYLPHFKELVEREEKDGESN